MRSGDQMEPSVPMGSRPKNPERGQCPQATPVSEVRPPAVDGGRRV